MLYRVNCRIHPKFDRLFLEEIDVEAVTGQEACEMACRLLFEKYSAKYPEIAPGMPALGVAALTALPAPSGSDYRPANGTAAPLETSDRPAPPAAMPLRSWSVRGFVKGGDGRHQQIDIRARTPDEATDLVQQKYRKSGGSVFNVLGVLPTPLAETKIEETEEERANRRRRGARANSAPLPKQDDLRALTDQIAERLA